MSVSQRLSNPGFHQGRPVNPEHVYSEDQENWSDDPSNEHDDEAPRRRTRQHVMPSRSGSSSFMPGGETVPYTHAAPRRGDGGPFASASGPGPRPYPGYHWIPPPPQTPYTSTQQYPSQPGGFPHGSGYYPAAQFGTSYTPAPHPQPNPYSPRPYLPNMPPGQPPYDYVPPLQPSPQQQFSSHLSEGRTGIRRPSIRLRTSQQEGAEHDREAAEQLWRERNRQRERERKEADKREREREKKEREREKKERERETKRESDRIQQERLKLKVQKLRQQLQLERSKRPVSGAFDSTLQDLLEDLHDQRERENQRRWIERRAGPLDQFLQVLAELADTRRVSPYQQDRLQWTGGPPFRPRPPTRSDLGEAGYETVPRSQIEEVVMDLLSRWSASDEQEKARLPLPPASQSTARGAREDFHADDRSPRGPTPEWQAGEGGAASPRPRFGDAPGTVSDAHWGPSSPRYRSGDTSGTTPPTPKPERRQTASPANIKVAMSGSTKRPRGSVSSEYSSAAGRGGFPTRGSPEALPRRTEPGKTELRRSESHRPPGRRGSQSAPRPSVLSPESPRVRHRSRNSVIGHIVSFKDQDPAGDRPIADDGEDDLSGSDTEDGAVGPRQTRPYRFMGEKVQGRRYDPRDAQGLTTPPPPPAVPDVPRPEVGDPGAGGQRRVARVDSWPDDGEEERRHAARSPSTVGRYV